MTQKARNYTVKPQNLNILREGSQGIGMHKYGRERVLILQFVKKWFMACRYLESISSSHVWNLMLNAHKQGGAKLYGNTGCNVLHSGVLCVLFYTEILPFSLFFSWSAVYGPIWTHRNWLLVSLIRCFCGCFVGCLSVMPLLEWKLIKQHRGRHTMRQEVWTQLQGERRHVSFTASAGPMGFAETRVRDLLFSLACLIPFSMTKQTCHPLHKFLTKIRHLSAGLSQAWV